MLLKNIITLVFSVVVICESAFVDTLFKCKKDDGECQKKLIADVLPRLGPGVPEIGLPPIDPLYIDHRNFTIIEVTISFDGHVKKVSKCNVLQFTPNVDKGLAIIKLMCPQIVVEGKYTVFSAGQLVKDIAGGEVTGNGDGKIKIPNLTLTIHLPFKVVKRGDDIFLSGLKKKLTYTYDIGGKLHFKANNLLVAGVESSTSIIKIMNDNSDIMVSTFGKFIMDIAIDYLYDTLNIFFNQVACRYYFEEDLSGYVKV